MEVREGVIKSFFSSDFLRKKVLCCYCFVFVTGKVVEIFVSFFREGDEELFFGRKLFGRC